MSTSVPPGGILGAQPLARKFPSSSTWIAFRSTGSLPTIDGSMRGHVQSPSLLILLHLENCTRWSSTNVGTPDTEHGGLVDRLSGIPGLNPPPANVAPPKR